MRARAEGTTHWVVDPKDCDVIDDEVLLGALTEIGAVRQLVPTRRGGVYYVARNDVRLARALVKSRLRDLQLI